MTNEEQAIAFGNDSVKVEYRLRQASRLLLNDYRKRFDIKARYDALSRTLISGDHRYLLRWMLRNKPDQPEGYLNQQTTQGIVVLCVIGAFEVDPNL